MINLSRLPPPDVVQPLDYETILERLKQRFKDACESRGVAFDAFVESDPAMILLEVAAYEVMLNRQTSNDDARALMLAYAQGADLRHLAANMGVEIKVIDAGDPDAIPPVQPTYEDDALLRRRIQLAPESLTNAGTGPAYVFHALSVAGVVDATAISPTPGDVIVTVLGVNGDTPPDLIASADAALRHEDVRQLTDHLTVQAPERIEWTLDAVLTLRPGPSGAPVLAAAQANISAYLAQSLALGRDVRRSALFAALHVSGVNSVELRAPLTDVIADQHQVAVCLNNAIVMEEVRDV